MSTIEQHLETWQLETLTLQIPTGFSIEHSITTSEEMAARAGIDILLEEAGREFIREAGIITKIETKVAEQTFGALGFLPLGILDAVTSDRLHNIVVDHVYGLIHTVVETMKQDAKAT